MSDLISRQAAIDAICRECQGTFLPCESFPCDEIEALKELPSAQQEIIRCKDCKHRYVGGNGMTHYFVCDFMEAQYDDEGFCSHAERKGEKDE